VTAVPMLSIRNGRPELALPLVCDSPHSGTLYPADFGHAIARAELRYGEDTHVERLWDHAPQVGATLIAAHFPRTYIDVNRALSDIDPGMLDAPWPRPIAPTDKTALGMGLIWRQVRAGAPIYARRLTVAEVKQRIALCWGPYREALRHASQRALRRFGQCFHLNLHSMPSDAYQRLGIASPTPLADFVLGDRRGRSCDREFVALVKRAIEAHGYRVAVNDPYEGQELVRVMGEPAEHRHSLQIEVNRALYMDEATREPNAHFDDLRADLASVLEEVARHIRLRCATSSCSTAARC
jgi:N-formylglutamate deformylase